MITFYNKYKRDFVYSQNGEEGIVAACFKRMEVTEPVMCEFGAHNGKYCSNTRYFVENYGGSSLMIEGNSSLYETMYNYSKGFNIVPVHSMVHPATINKFLSILQSNFHLLSIDTDGDNDYDCFAAMESRPAIVIIEIDSSIHPNESGKKTGYFDMVSLAISKGYFLLCHTGNLVFVHNYFKYLFPEVIGNAIDNSKLYFNTSWLKH